MLYGRKCPPTETNAVYISRILRLIFLFVVFASHLYSQSPTIPECSRRLDLPVKPVWAVTEANIDGGKIASDNAYIYYTISNSGKVISVDITSGIVEWEIDLGGQVQATPYVLGDGLFIITRNEKNYTVRRLNKSTGLPVWQTRIVQDLTVSPPEFYLSSLNDTLIIAATDGSFRAVELATGRIAESEFTRMEMATAPYFQEDRVVFGTTDRQIVVYSLSDLRIAAELAGSSVPSTASAVLQSRNNLIWGDALGIVRLFDRRQSSTGEKLKNRWKFRTGGKISHLTLIDRKNRNENGGGVLISSLDNFIYLVSQKTGKLIWKKRSSGRIIFAPQVSDGYLVLTDADSSTATVLEISSGRTVNKISLPNENLFTGTVVVAQQSIILPGTGGLFAFASATSCRN